MSSEFSLAREEAEQLLALLSKVGLTLAFAESCTGGLAAASLVNLPGASAVFFGGVVAYDNSVKERLLHVARQTLETDGAVSAACAAQMARGARLALGTSLAVSVTGIAGPGGGSAEKPVGLVYIGVDSPAGTRTQKLMLGELGGRDAVRAESVRRMMAEALSEIRRLHPEQK